jgi:regulator of RNase E activity RraA
VLVVGMNGDRRHAPVGAVTAAAAKAQDAAAIVVDGVATDLALASDAAEPELLARIAGEPLETLLVH